MSTGASEIFNTVPTDYMSLFQGEYPDFKGVVDKLELKKTDVSQATGISLGSVRYDQKIPNILKQIIREWAILLNMVAGHFKGDQDRTVIWFTISNPMLGDITPRDMIRLGRFNKLYSFVNTALAENKQ